MIPAEYYELIYIIIILLCAIPVLAKYSNGWTIYVLNREIEPISKSLLFTIFIILFVGFRPNSPLFFDGTGYWAAMLDHRWEGLTLREANNQYATLWLMSFMSSNGFSPRLAFIVYATIIYGGAFIAMRKSFPNDTMLAMILFCGTFGTFGGAVNGIKSGMAISMFLCAVAYKDNWKICLMFLALSFGFHHSLELSIGAFFLCNLYKNNKAYFILWIICLVIAILHITYFQTLLADFTDEHGAEYLLSTEQKLTGNGVFRFDFVLYSAAPLVLGYWVIYKNWIESKQYQFVLNVYLVENSIWLLCMYANYTNRIASLSWCLFPLLILRPLINERISFNQHKVLVWFVVGQLLFTLFMNIRDLLW